jgi:hypothetical protein
MSLLGGTYMALANNKLIPTQKHCANLLVCIRPNGRNYAARMATKTALWNSK